MTVPINKNTIVRVSRAAANHVGINTLCVVSNTRRVNATRAKPSPEFETVCPNIKSGVATTNELKNRPFLLHYRELGSRTMTSRVA